MRAAAVALLLAGCSTSIELALDLDTAAVPAGFDMSCIAAVDVLALSDATFLDETGDIGGHYASAADTPSCVEVSGVTTLGGLETKLRGHVELALPDDGLASVILRARQYGCDVHDAESMVYGGGRYAGGNQLTVHVEPNLSCDKQTTTTVMPLDLIAMTTDPAHACVKQADTTSQDSTFDGTIRPTRLADTGIDVMTFELGNSITALGANGVSTSVITYTEAIGTSCAAIGRASANAQGGGCVNLGQPVLCAPSAATTVELPVVVPSKVTDLYPAQDLEAFGPPVFVFVWEKSGTAIKPLGGVKAVVSDPARAKLVYLALVNGIPTATTDQVTGPSGMIEVFTHGISALTLTEATHHDVKILIGAPPRYATGTGLAVLTPK